MTRSMVTTTDNPYNPFDNFDEWERWDKDHGYFTMNYLMRIANIPSDCSAQIVYSLLEDAVDEIVKMNLTGNYVKVVGEEEE